jgi:hypothetical protein
VPNQVGTRRSKPRGRRTAYSLLEVVLASGLCASALVPGLALLRDGVTLAEDISDRHQLLLYGVSMLEEHTAIVAANWIDGTATGDFAADGHANMRYIVGRSDDAFNGGIDDRLMNISVTVYRDDDGDDALGAAEMRTVLTTKISRLISYESKAGS